MCDQDSILHIEPNIPTLSDIRKKVIELNSFDLCDESQNQIYFDELSAIISNLAEFYKETHENYDENIIEIVEEIFSIVFLLCENAQPQLFQLIPPLFILKSVSKSTLSQFCLFLNHLKKHIPEFEFDDEIIGFINSTKEILYETVKKIQNQIEFTDLLTNSKLYLTINDSIEILSIILFLTDKYTEISDISFISNFLIAPFQIEKRVPPFFIDFLSHTIKLGLIKEIETVLFKPTIEMLDNETLILLAENPSTNDAIFTMICKIANHIKYQPLCNSVALKYIEDKKDKHLIPDKLIIQIINNCIIEQFSLEFWNEVGNLESNINLHESIIDRIITNFHDIQKQQQEGEENVLSLQTVLSKLVFDPNSILSHEESVDILKNSKDNIAINCILTMNFNDDILNDPFFWVQYSQNFKREKNYKNAVQCFWFRYRNSQIKIADILFYSNTQPNENTCNFIQNVFDYFNTTFMVEKINFNQIIYENVKSPLFPSFWKLFKGYRITQLYNEAPEDKKFFFYYGLCCDSFFISPPIDVINFRKLEPESYEYLHSIIEGTTSISFESALPENIPSDLLFFISSTLMCFNIRSINLIKEITFNNGPDFFLFLALLNRIISSKSSHFTRIFDGKCLYDAFEKTKSIFNEEECINNINSFISITLFNFNNSQTIDKFFRILIETVDYLWENFKDADILSKFPNFVELAYKLYSFYIRKSELYLNTLHIHTNFPRSIDHDLIRLLFEYFKEKKKLDNSYNFNYMQLNVDVSELLKEPSPELFSFLKKYLDIDYSKIKSDQFDENLIISSFFDQLKIDDKLNQSINQLIKELNEEQIFAIINEFVDSTSFDSLIQIILQEMSRNDQIKILSIEKYLNFIRKEVYKTLYYVAEQESRHELSSTINEYLKNHPEIKISLNPEDPNFLNADELNNISNQSLFELDDILNSSFLSEKDRIFESILFLIKFTIHKFVNQEEIPDEIKTNLFLSSYKNELSNENESNFDLLPTFESFSNLRNIVKHILNEIFVLGKTNELNPFLTPEQTKFVNLNSFSFVMNDMKYQEYFIIKTCPLFKTNNFPILDLLKMHLLDQFNTDCDNALFNAINLRLCSGSTGVLYYINFLSSCSSHLKIDKDSLIDYLHQCYLNTPESHICLENAISKMFVSTEDGELIYLDVNYSLLKKPSRQSIQFVRNYLLKGPFTISYFTFLSSLALAYPHLLSSVFDVNECNFDDQVNNHDIIWFIKRIIPLIKGNINEYFNFPHESCTDSIISLIANLIKIPQIGDQIVQFFFENLLDFNYDVIVAFLFILRMECDYSSLQSIIVGYLIRYNFPELAQKIITKLNSIEDNSIVKYSINQNYLSEEQKFEIIKEEPIKNEEEEEKNEKEEEDETKKEDEDSYQSVTEQIKLQVKKINDKYQNYSRHNPESIKRSITQSISFLLLLLIRYEENEIHDSYGITLMISRRENPLKEFTENSFRFMPDIQWSPNSIDETSQTPEFKAASFIPLSETDRENVDSLINNIEKVDYNYRTPLDIPVDYFQELPTDYANQLIIERIPKLNTRITADVYEMLLKYPAWVSNWIIQRPSTVLIQQQYDIINGCINEINSLHSENESSILEAPKSLTSSSFLIKNTEETKSVDQTEIKEPPLNYESICDFIYKSEIYNNRENSSILYTLFLYISSHKPYSTDDDDESFHFPNPKEILIFYAKKMLKGTNFVSNYRSILYSFDPISTDIIDDIIDLACSPMFRSNSDFLENILQFYKSKAFYRKGEIVNKKGNRNHSQINQGNELDFSLYNNQPVNNDIISIQYLLNHYPFIGMNNNNINNNINNSNENEGENKEEEEEEEDYSDIDEFYRYDFFVILTMSESPKVLSSTFIYAPQHLIHASLKRGSCISNAFLRCLNSKDIQKYTNFFKLLKKYKTFYEDHEIQIIEKIRNLLTNPESNSSQIISLFSMLSYQKISDPKKVCEEYYDTLTPFWQLVYDAREFISKTLLEENNLINTSFIFMKPVVHTLSFDFRVKYLKIFVRDLITTKTKSIVVRRENILEDSFKTIMNMTPNEFLGRISINFDGERGIDAGGLLRDWFTNLAKSLFNENYALFVSSKVHGTFLPNPNSYVNGNHLKYFEFAGRIFARAIVEQINLEPHLALALRKKLLKYDLTIDDIEEFDPDLFTSLKWILENDLSANPDFEMYFTADTDNIGKHEVYELIENGAKTLVTNENKQMFVQKTIEYRTDVAIQDQSCAFCTGFFSIIPFEKIGIFTPEELDRIICGESFIDVDDWQRNCHFSGDFSINHPTIVTFFNVIKKWEQKDIAKLLYFITGSPQVPLGGFAAYKELGRPITIGSVDERNKLITAHTCSNMLDLPVYETEEELDDKIRLAIHECNSFDFH